MLLLGMFSATAHSQSTASDSSEDSTLLEIHMLKMSFLKNFYWWETSISKKSQSWYRSDEGRTMAENILSWQYDGGGWPLMNTADTPFSGDSSMTGPWGMKAALIKASTNEIRFLARAYDATKDERYRTAAIGGLSFILDAQYESGGWPHSYPYRMTDYSHYATFNDDEIPDIMTFLAEVSASPEFKMLGNEYLENINIAYEKGLDFILKSQIVVNNQLTAWPQQCDEFTYVPKPARAFEPAAISSSESASVLLFLMGIRKPSTEIIKAVESAVQWYRDVQINGLKMIRAENDLVVKPDSLAPPLWARFYEIGTNTPIFAGRDSLIRYSLEDIEQERRTGYQWYNQKGTQLFKRHKEWLYERKWDNQPATNTDEAKVGKYTLPDPLHFIDGGKVRSLAEWKERRRPELIELFEQYQFGHLPDKTIRTSIEVIEQDAPGMNGLSRRTQVRIVFPDYPNTPSIRVCVNVPSKTAEPVPTLLHLSFSPNSLLYNESRIDEGMAWSARLKAQIPDKDAYLLKDIHPEHFIERGYGIATVYYGDIEPDFDHGGTFGIRSMFGADDKREVDEWGAIGAWSWGLSRVMDYLETHPSVDSKKVALSGVSRLGKTVLWTAAMDQRFSMVIPMLSGEGGATLSRRFYGETIADLTNPFRYDYWYAPRYAEFAFNQDELPVDGHLLLSLMAPRPVLQIVGSTDTWSDPRGEWVSAIAAQPVYALYGLKGSAGKEMPLSEQVVFHHMGFYMHEGKHTVYPRDFKVMTDFMDLHFKDSKMR